MCDDSTNTEFRQVDLFEFWLSVVWSRFFCDIGTALQARYRVTLINRHDLRFGWCGFRLLNWLLDDDSLLEWVLLHGSRLRGGHILVLILGNDRTEQTDIFILGMFADACIFKRRVFIAFEVVDSAVHKRVIEDSKGDEQLEILHS